MVDGMGFVKGNNFLINLYLCNFSVISKTLKKDVLQILAISNKFFVPSE